MMGKPILCVDFDGVIHAYTSPWTDETTISDGPVPGAIEFLLEAIKHFDVVIYSSRSRTSFGRVAMMSWLREHAGFAWHDLPSGRGIKNVGFASEKPAAFLTIDDRAFCFEGTWPDPDKLRDFKPWNKRNG
jgi:hypothetical protein